MWDLSLVQLAAGYHLSLCCVLPQCPWSNLNLISLVSFACSTLVTHRDPNTPNSISQEALSLLDLTRAGSWQQTLECPGFLLSYPRPSTGGKHTQYPAGLLPMPPGPAQEVTNHDSLYSSYHIVPGWSQVVADLDLHQSPSQEAPTPTYLQVGFIPQQSATHLASQVAHPMGSLNRHQSLLGKILFNGVRPLAQQFVSCEHGQTPPPVSLKFNPTH